MSSAAWAASIGSPAAAAAASACRNSRRVIECATAAAAMAFRSLVDRRSGIHQQRNDVPDLLLGKDMAVSEARHVRARGVRLCVVDLAPRVFARFIGEAAQLSEAIQRWTDRPVRDLLRRQLMTRIAGGSRRALRIGGELESLA